MKDSERNGEVTRKYMRGEDRMAMRWGDGGKQEGGRLQYSRGVEEVVGRGGRQRGRMGSRRNGDREVEGPCKAERGGEGWFARAAHYDGEG